MGQQKDFMFCIYKTIILPIGGKNMKYKCWKTKCSCKYVDIRGMKNMSMNMRAFWDIATCGVIRMMEAVCTSEMSLYTKVT
jgi:hypothetical protein